MVTYKLKSNKRILTLALFRVLDIILSIDLQFAGRLLPTKQFDFGLLVIFVCVLYALKEMDS